MFQFKFKFWFHLIHFPSILILFNCNTFIFYFINRCENGEVLDKEENPIHGLFAAGEMVGGLFSHNYSGGSGLMSGSASGKIAGTSAAKYVKSQLV